MKKLFFSLILCLVPIGVFAQGIPQRTKTFNFKSATTSPTEDVGSNGYGYYKIKWEVKGGTLSACTVKLEGSVDGSTWNVNNITGTQTCTSDGETAVSAAGIASSFIRINVLTYTTSSAGVSLNVTFSAWNEVMGATSSNPIASTATFGWPITCQTATSGVNCFVIPVYSDTGNGIKSTDVVPSNLVYAVGQTVTTLSTSGAAVATIVASAAGLTGLAVDSGINTDDTWVVLFNATSGNVTLGVTAPKLIFKMPGGTSPTGGASIPIPFGNPISTDFTTAISWACLKTNAWGLTLASNNCNISYQYKQ